MERFARNGRTPAIPPFAGVFFFQDAGDDIGSLNGLILAFGGSIDNP